YWFFMVSVLLVIFVYDLKHYLIPDSLIGLGSAAALFFSLAKVFYFGGDSLFLDFIPLELNAWQPFLGNLLAALGAGGFFGLIVLITRGRGMGRGDIKLAFLMGLILGWPKILVALFLAFLGGATLGLILVALGRKNLKSALPFGPFLVSGTILAVWLGSFISAWYQALLGF
ncbi:MAG: A24 family peptidase, partial [Patescibacteria group bacterium]